MRQNRFAITCKPLTPLWTGDANGVCPHIRETGLIGSLRWWYEAVLRGCGIYACDPSKGSCVYEKERGLQKICLACQLFGCTGWSRRFRLEVDGGAGAGEPREVKLREPGTANHRGWRIPTDVSGPFTMKIVLLFGADWDTDGLSLTLRLIERYGAFGGKTSHGQGVVRFDGIPADDGLAQWMESLKKKEHKQCAQPPGAPDMTDFVGVTVEVKPEKLGWWKELGLSFDRRFNIKDDSTWIPSAPAVRAMLRSELRVEGWSNDRHRLMGTTTDPWGDPKSEGKDPRSKDRTKGSDVFVTHLYRQNDHWQMRIFGFVPRDESKANQRIRELLGGAELTEKLKQIGLPVTSVERCPVGLENLFGGAR